MNRAKALFDVMAWRNARMGRWPRLYVVDVRRARRKFRPGCWRRRTA
jgi:hypothetical protein